MKRRKFKLLVCSAIFGTSLAGTLLTQAAGPDDMLSRFWQARPRVLKPAESPLNPGNWFERDSDRKHVGGSETPGTARVDVSRPVSQVTVRPELVRDPFAQAAPSAHSAPNQSAQKTAGGIAPRSSTTAPSNITSIRDAEADRRAIAARFLSAGQQLPDADAARAPLSLAQGESQAGINGETAAADVAPRLPSSLSLSEVQRGSRTGELPEFQPGQVDSSRGESARSDASQTRVASDETATSGTRTAQVSNTRPTSGTAGGNQFSPGFDVEFQRLVSSVVREDAARPQVPAGSLFEMNRQALADAAQAPRLPDSLQASPGPTATTGSREPSAGSGSGAKLAVTSLPHEPLMKSGEAGPVVQSRRDLLADIRPTASSERGSAAPEITPQFKTLGTTGSHQTESGSAATASAPGMTRQVAMTRNDETGRELMLLPERATSTVSVPQDSRWSDPFTSSGAHGHDVRIVPGESGSGIYLETSQASVVKPRVTSNAPPSRVVPDNSQLRRMSWSGEGTQAVQANGMQMPDTAAAPQTAFRPSWSTPPAGDHASQLRFPATGKTTPVQDVDAHRESMLQFPPQHDEQGDLPVSTIGDNPAPAAFGTGPNGEPQSVSTIQWPTPEEWQPSSGSAGHSRWLLSGACLSVFAAAGVLLRRRWKSR